MDSIYHPDQATVNWAAVPYDPLRPQAPDPETRELAEAALSCLTPAERAVVEHFYGFAGDPKTDDEVALVLHSTRGTVKKQRQRALEKMRSRLGAG